MYFLAFPARKSFSESGIVKQLFYIRITLFSFLISNFAAIVLQLLLLLPLRNP
jgi:hypothetical protein